MGTATNQNLTVFLNRCYFSDSYQGCFFHSLLYSLIVTHFFRVSSCILRGMQRKEQEYWCQSYLPTWSIPLFVRFRFPFQIPGSPFLIPLSWFPIFYSDSDSGFRVPVSGFRIPDFSIRPNSSTTSTLFQCLIFWLALRPTNRGHYLNYLLMINIYT